MEEYNGMSKIGEFKVSNEARWEETY